ncbi:iron chelate uptake ABC transporter family permease subunit, partial [Aeromicrobium sp.]|uniref:iron chelate uptake ABC transporter family permease subunit n=1 Tax=Aeromicrobium sp. TaxID=1871063 RepID=UPI0028A5F1A1
MSEQTRSRRITLSLGPVGIALPRRVWVTASALTALLVGVMVAALFLGTLSFGADRVAATLLGTGTRVEQLVIVEGRLVRVVGALLVGFGLGLSGALTQSITRNPIASPDILGVTTGASAVAVFFVTNPDTGLAPSAASATSILTPAALLGGLLTTALILALAWRGGFDGMRLVLVGLGVNAVAVAAIGWMMTRASTDGAAVAARWLSGSVMGVKPEDLALLAPVVVAGTLACLALNRSVASLRVGRGV